MKFVIFSIIYLKIIIQFVSSSNDVDNVRKLETFLNPGCPKNICVNETIITLIHILANGSNDSVHYIWDFTGKPTVLLALTPLNTTLSINWANFMDDHISDSISFSTKPIYTATLVINKIYEFNDVEDTGTFSVTNSSEINTYDTQNFTWIRKNFYESVREVGLTVAGDNTYFLGDGNIILKLKCFDVRDHDIDFPHLLHSENTTQVDLVFENIKVDSRFNAARFAAEFILITDEQKNGDESFSILNRKSLDDEYTPGIFELIEVASPESFKASRGTFMQYRPVCYTHRERDVSTSTDTHITIPINLDDPLAQLNGSLAYVYYGYMLDELLVQGFNVSYGVSGDGFYEKTNYNSWTFIMGYGGAPTERLSKFVIIVSTIGVGVPLLLLFIGGIYIYLKRARNRLSTHY